MTGRHLDDGPVRDYRVDVHFATRRPYLQSRRTVPGGSCTTITASTASRNVGQLRLPPLNTRGATIEGDLPAFEGD